MDHQHLMGLMIAIVANIGGLAVGAYTDYVSVIGSAKERVDAIEAANKERLALIEKGTDSNLLKTKKRPGSDPLLWGLLLAGIGWGVFVPARRI